MADFDLGSLEVTNGGLDAFLGGHPEVVTPVATSKPAPAAARTGRTKVGSLAQLNGFIRTAEDTLVHKSSRELWALRQDGGGGDFYIERMFDETGGPLKG